MNCSIILIGINMFDRQIYRKSIKCYLKNSKAPRYINSSISHDKLISLIIITNDVKQTLNLLLHKYLTKSCMLFHNKVIQVNLHRNM